MENDSILDSSQVAIAKRDAVIESANSLSSIIDTGAGSIVGIEFPAEFDGTEITFQTSTNGVNFKDYYDDQGSEIFKNVFANKILNVNPADFLSVKFIKIRSGTSALTVNQTAQRTIGVILRVFK